MLKEKIESLREEINRLMASEHCSKAELVEKSREMDRLVLKYMKKDQRSD